MKTSFQVFAGLAVISFSLLVRSGFSKEISRIPHQKKSLETLLNQDGTLDMVRGFNGSLDPTGWKMVTDRDGRPRFVRSNVQMKSKLPSEVMAEGDENWDSQFTLSGLDGNVNTIVISESNMYVGGEFTVAGSVPVTNEYGTGYSEFELRCINPAHTEL